MAERGDVVTLCRDDDPRGRNEQMYAVGEAAQLAFWAKVSELFPEATSGDFPPDASAAFNLAATRAVGVWIEWNVPCGGTS